MQDRDQRKTRVNDLTAAPVEKDGKCSRNRIKCVITKATSIYPFTVVRNLLKFLLLNLNLFQSRFVFRLHCLPSRVSSKPLQSYFIYRFVLCSFSSSTVFPDSTPLPSRCFKCWHEFQSVTYSVSRLFAGDTKSWGRRQAHRGSFGGILVGKKHKTEFRQ